MSLPKITGKIQLSKSNTINVDGTASAPTTDSLEYGQLAVNYNASDPSLFFKVYDTVSETDKIVKIVTEQVIVDTLEEILGSAAANINTLKELLEAFGNSDIAVTQASILTRLSSVESGKVDKVTGKGLSTNDYTTTEKEKLSGIAAGAQVNTVTSVAGKTGPVTLTNTDVGLGNVVNKEQLGKTETAADSDKLCGSHKSSYIFNAEFMHGGSDNNFLTAQCNVIGYAYGKGTAGVADSTEYAPWGSILRYGAASDYATMLALHGTTSCFRYGNSDWINLYTALNSNLSTIPWACSNLTSGDITKDTFSAIENVRNGYRARFCSSGNALRLYNIGANGDEGTLLLNKSGVQYSVDNATFYNMYHAGNSNRKDVGWNCSTLNVNYINHKNFRIYGDTNTLEIAPKFDGDADFDYVNKLGYKPDRKWRIGTDLIWHAGNSNKADVEWAARVSRATWFAANNNEPNTNGNYIILEGGDGKGDNKYGGNVSISAGKGTGTAGSGSIAFNVGTGTTTSGSSVNPLQQAGIILPNGYWGIGTGTPVEKLTVNGKVKLMFAQDGTDGKVCEVLTMGYVGDNGVADNVNRKHSISQSITAGAGASNFMTLNVYSGGTTGTPTEVIRFRGDGNVGIGTTTPESKLDINGNFIARGDARSAIIGKGQDVGLNIQTDGTYSAIRFFKGLSPVGVIHGIDGLSGTTGKVLNIQGDDYVTLGNWNAPELTVDVVGKKIGIGTATPSERLDVNGNIRLFNGSSNLKFLARSGGSDIISSGELCPHYASNFTVYKGAAGSGQVVMSCDVNKNVGIGTLTPTEKLDVNGNGLFSGNVTAKGDVVAYSAASNVRIEPLAGASALFDLTDVELPADLTSANNHVLAYNIDKKKWTAVESAGTGGTPVDYSRLANVPTTYMPCPHTHEDATYVSDIRLKEHVENIPNALNTILSLTGKKYQWTQQARDEFNMKDEHSFGYIAQDVQEIIPEIVKKLENHSEFVGVEYIKVVPFITEAIKEMHNLYAGKFKELDKKQIQTNRIISEYYNTNKQLNDRVDELTSIINAMKK